MTFLVWCLLIGLPLIFILASTQGLFHTLGYSGSVTATQPTNQDLVAVNDVIIGIRNSHFIATDQFTLQYAYGLSKTISGLRVNDPTLNAFFRHQFWPLDTGAIALATVPDRPAIISYRDSPITIPTNEEFALEWSAANSTETAIALMWWFTPDHQWSLPGGIIRLVCDATYSITPGATYTWTGGSALTFQQNLRGGWYQVNGLAVFDAGVIAARLIFPRGRAYDGRILRPGVLAQQAVGNRPHGEFLGKMGVYGYFHSFEPVQIEIFSTTVGAHAGDIKLDLTYLGNQAPPGYSTAGGS